MRLQDKSSVVLTRVGPTEAAGPGHIASGWRAMPIRSHAFLLGRACIS